MAEEEVRQKLQPSLLKRGEKTGKIFFATDKPLEEIFKLRSAENIYAFVSEKSGIPSDDKGLGSNQNVVDNK